MNLLTIVLSAGVAAIFLRVWTGAKRGHGIDGVPLSVIEREHPFLPSPALIVTIAFLAAGIFLLDSYVHGAEWRILLQNADVLLIMGGVLAIIGFLSFLGLLGMLGSIVLLILLIGGGVSAYHYLQAETWRAILDERFVASVVIFVLFVLIGSLFLLSDARRNPSANRYRLFSIFLVGTVLTWILIGVGVLLFHGGSKQDPFLMALAIICVVIAWRFLFGPESPHIRAMLIATFLFWFEYWTLRSQPLSEIGAAGIAAAIGFAPVFVFYVILLAYRRQRWCLIFLAFFGGMLSVAPSLFYQLLALQGVQLNFFLFTLMFHSLPDATSLFVQRDTFLHVSGLQTAAAGSLITYLFVGVIEEGSKFWVLLHCRDQSVTSVRDFLHLAIIISVGFAFAENMTNPELFVGFVKQFLHAPGQWGAGVLALNIVGRSVISLMVHALSTGLLGYFVGRAFMASSLGVQQRAHPILQRIHRVTDLNVTVMERSIRIGKGFLFGVLAHGLFDFTVSLIDLVNRDVGAGGIKISALPSSTQAIFYAVSGITAVYVVGGFFLLFHLLKRSERMGEIAALFRGASPDPNKLDAYLPPVGGVTVQSSATSDAAPATMAAQGT
ncbi:hypothetical protein HYR82_04505 [Candidatus Peregrinibacteria bacterium]|nr:hypothetical protein [Candidatus Peregrinibacteria bacterium]